MPWGAIAGAAIGAQLVQHRALAQVTGVRTRRSGVLARAERMARKRWLAKWRPAIVTCGCAIGLWLGYHALMWALWWQPHSTALINTVYP